MKFGLANIATLCAALGHPQRRVPVGHRRRHQRQGIGHGDGRHGAARRRASQRALHVAASGAARGTVRHRRPGGRAGGARACGRAHPRRRRSVSSRRASSRRCRPSSSARRPSPSSCSARRASTWPCSKSGSAAASTPPTSSRPIAAAIVSIDFDHEEQLGHTLASIAAEKAGRHQAGDPGRLRPAADGGARRDRGGLRASSRRRSSGPTRIAALIGSRRGACRSRSPGAHQQANAAVAVRLLEAIDQDAGAAVCASARTRCARGSPTAAWPGRLETFTRGDCRDPARRGAQSGRRARAGVLSASRPLPAGSRSSSARCATRRCARC